MLDLSAQFGKISGEIEIGNGVWAVRNKVKAE